MTQLKIREEESELKGWLRQEARGRQTERLLALYLLKTKQVKSATQLPYFLGRSYSTIKNGLTVYRQRGISGLLELQHGGGRNLSLPEPVLASLKKRLQSPQGFSDDQAIQSWLTVTYDIDIPYKTLWGLVHHRFQARPKKVRPQSPARNESSVAEFEKKKSRACKPWPRFTAVKDNPSVMGVKMKAVLG